MEPQQNRAEVSWRQNLYITDFYAWTQQQADLLRKERQELKNRLSILIGHLLKWEYQSTRRSHSWSATIRIQRRELLKLLSENPSLQSPIIAAMTEAYENGRDLASAETNLPLSEFPEQCSYLWTDLLDIDFYPD